MWEGGGRHRKGENLAIAMEYCTWQASVGIRYQIVRSIYGVQSGCTVLCTHICFVDWLGVVAKERNPSPINIYIELQVATGRVLHTPNVKAGVIFPLKGTLGSHVVSVGQ